MYCTGTWSQSWGCHLGRAAPIVKSLLALALYLQKSTKQINYVTKINNTTKQGLPPTSTATVGIKKIWSEKNQIKKNLSRLKSATPVRYFTEKTHLYKFKNSDCQVSLKPAEKKIVIENPE